MWLTLPKTSDFCLLLPKKSIVLMVSKTADFQGPATPRSRKLGIDLGVGNRFQTSILGIDKKIPDSDFDFKFFENHSRLRLRL